MAQVVADQWRQLPPVVPETALVPAGTEPDLTDSGVSRPVQSAQSRIEQLRSSTEIGGSRIMEHPAPNTPPQALGPVVLAQHRPLPEVRLQPTTRRDIMRSLSCNRRSVSTPRTRAGGLDAPDVAAASARGLVDSIQSTAHSLTVTAASVAAPVVLAGGTVVAGGVVGGMVGQEMAGEAADQTLGEWSRPAGEMIGKAVGAVSGTTMTNTAMALASGCQRRAPPPERPRRSSTSPRTAEFYALTGDEGDNEPGGSYGRSTASQSNLTREDMKTLQDELSKLNDLNDNAHGIVDSRRRRSQSRDAAVTARQDALDAKLDSMRRMMEEQSKHMVNLLSPLSAEISGRFAEQAQQFEGLRDEVHRGGREARRRIRNMQADLDCVTQQMQDPGDYAENDNDEEQHEQDVAEIIYQTRGDPVHGEVTYEGLVAAVQAIHPQCTISYINEHWSMLPIITDGEVALRAVEAPAQAGAPAPPASAPARPLVLEPGPAGTRALPTERSLFSPGPAPLQQFPTTAGTIQRPNATTYVSAIPSFDPSGGVANGISIPGPLHPTTTGRTTPYVALPLDSTEVARRESVRATLVAAKKEAQDEQLQKTVERIPNFPACGDATELEEFLTKIADSIRTASRDPDMMARWIREATITAAVATPESYEEWFDHMADSGKGFVRADILLLMQIKTATRKAAHLHNRIGVKQLEFTKKAATCVDAKLYSWFVSTSRSLPRTGSTLIGGKSMLSTCKATTSRATGIALRSPCRSWIPVTSLTTPTSWTRS